MPYVDGRKVSGAIKTAAADTLVLLLTGRRVERRASAVICEAAHTLLAADTY
jgi:hypothetical protein